MSTSRLRASQVLNALLALALVVLIFILARGILRNAPGPTPEGLPAETPAPSATPQSAEGALAPVPTVDQTLAAVVRPSLLQEWASAVTQQAIEHPIGVSHPARADFAWLPENGLWGPLAQAAGGVAIGGQVVPLDGRTAVEVVLPEASKQGGLSSVGRVEYDGNTLTLRQTTAESNGQSVRSLSGGTQLGDVLKALAQEAEARQVVLLVAYWETPGGEATLALVEALPASDEAQTAEATPKPGTPPPATPTPSATFIYQPDIRLAVESGLAPLIEAAQHPSSSRREAVAHFTQNHAWVGFLTWDADGPRVGGRSLGLDPNSTHALTLFGLADEDPTPVTTTLLEAHWDGSGTLVSSDGASERYYGFRLAEIVHWMVLVAEERGGQLEVAYDDVGGYRAITVLDFQPLPLPPGG